MLGAEADLVSSGLVQPDTDRSPAVFPDREGDSRAVLDLELVVACGQP